MPITIVKNGDSWKVMRVTTLDNNKERKTIASFSQKKQAKKFIKELTTEDSINYSSNLRTKTFDEAFEFSLNIIEKKGREKIIEECSADTYRQKIIYHIIPHIKSIGKKCLNEFTMDDFLNNFLINLNNSKTMGAKARTDKCISHKTYKEVISIFKSCIKDWIYADWDVGKLQKILAYKIPRTFKARGNKKPSEFFVTYDDAKKLIVNIDNIKEKLLALLSLVSAARLNEVLAVCVEDIDTKLGTVWIRHSLGTQSQFRENQTKTFDRVITITKELVDLIIVYKATHPNLKKECGGKYHRLFDYPKNQGAKIMQREAKKAGIVWEGGLAPWRKLGSTLIYNSGVLNEKEFCTRHGWSELPVFFKNYIRNTRAFEQQPRLESVFVDNTLRISNT